MHMVAVNTFPHAHHVDEPTEDATGKRERRAFETGNLTEERIVALRGRAAQRKHFIDPGELYPAEGAGQLREPEVVAGFGMVEPTALGLATLISQAAQARGARRIP